MATPVPGEQFIRTLRHYLDINESRLLGTIPPVPAIPESLASVKEKSNGGTTTSSFANAVSSLLGGVPSLRRRSLNNPPTGNNEPVLSSNQSVRSSSTPASLYGVQIPYMSLLAAASPNATALSMIPYMPPRSSLTLDIHHLYFLLVQFEHIGLDIGDPALLGEIPEGGVVETETTQTGGKAPSILSVGSMASTMSTLSLSTGWNAWQRRTQKTQSNTRPLHEDITHIYDFLSKITALKLHMSLQIDAASGTTRSGQRTIAGYEHPLPQDESVILSLSAFKHLEFLELTNIHPRLIDGWPELQKSLSSLVIKGAGVEDAAEVLEGVVNEGYERKKSRPEEKTEGRWKKLKMLSLVDNNLTTLDAEPLQHIRALTHLNLSSNLLIDVPAALASLYNLQSLNLSHNMISFITGINTVLGNIHELDLRGNRLTLLAGLDRLYALERVDLRDNRIEDGAEVGRLTSLPNIEDIWVEGNPFTILQPDYRVNLFTSFKACDIDIQLDGTKPSFVERRRVNAATVKDNYQAPAATVAAEQPQAGATWEEAKEANKMKAEAVSTPVKKIAKAKPKTTKRVVKLGKVEDEAEQVSEPSEDGRHLHRLAELEKAVKTESLGRKSTKRRSRSSRSPTGSVKSLGRDRRRSASPAFDPTNDEFRRRIEAMRREAGTEWLRVLQEMNIEGPKEENNDQQ
ncbi:hypothetical protein EC973_002513 [Apophysomyces ossiformis]|uniref:Uncharacterized protein n=1 Tax=Apophysomyces ossiformis TaxID=679940 RepID=A0A8H7ERY4_9FUNG|nr:hypothetical protein EC973_002513 [Apophysomyces ossiformis]